jgi:membrane protein YqaA with SNARE-associated domain
MQAWLDPSLPAGPAPVRPEHAVPGVLCLGHLLPLGSEPALFGLLKLNPELFWPAIAVATLGNTLGGALDWWMGYGAHRIADHYHRSPHHLRVLGWLRRLGPKACLLSWLPLLGDPLCAVAAGCACPSGPAWAGCWWASACATWP